MRIRSLYALALLSLSPWLGSCDSIQSGQLADNDAPPTLLRILVQDEGPAGGRNLATDILDQAPPISCSDTEPCPVSNQYQDPTFASGIYQPTCQIPAGQTSGTCPDPLSPATTPVAIGTRVVGGGNQIRLVFDKVLTSDIETATADPTTGNITYQLKDPTIVALIGPDGKEVPSVKYWDPSGSPYLTAQLFAAPYGPALVVKPQVALIPKAGYAVQIKPAGIVDKKGQAVDKDVNGPIQTSYPFTVEAFYPLGFMPQIDANEAVISPKDILTVRLNADFDETAIGATDVVISDEAGTPVTSLELFADRGLLPQRDDGSWETTKAPEACAADMNKRQLDIAYVSAPGVPGDWPTGRYSFVIKIVAADDKNVELAGGAFGQGQITGSFTVDPTKDPATDSAYYALPERCVATTPAGTDMAQPVDGGVTD